MVDRVVQFYPSLYQETEDWKPSVEWLEFGHLGVVESGYLSRGLRGRYYKLLRILRGIKP